jgi:hypothetical protein
MQPLVPVGSYMRLGRAGSRRLRWPNGRGSAAVGVFVRIVPDRAARVARHRQPA